MIKLYSPQTEVDLAIIRSILDGDGVKYFIHNDHFGSLRIGPSIKLYNAKTIMVSEKDYDRAAELVSDYIENTKPQNTDPKEFKSEYSFFDKIRIIIETILFGWTVPGKMKKNRQSEEE